MISFLPRGLVFSGPSDKHFPGAVPAGVAPIPDALGRFWSNFGPLDWKGQLRQLDLPAGTRAVAKLRDGYLLTDTKRTALWKWTDGKPPDRVATGTQRVLAVADDLVAYGADTSATGDVMHVLNLTTGRVAGVDPGGFTISARFSPDRSRLALFVLADGGQESVVLADPASGRVITRIDLSATSAGLHQFRGLAAAFQPVPFSWDGKGAQLVVVAPGPDSPVVDFVKATDGTIVRTKRVPVGLVQIEILTPPKA